MADLEVVQVVNRGNETFIFKYDGEGFKIPPGPEPISMVKYVALHAHLKSVFDIDIYENSRSYTIAVKGLHDCSMLNPEQNEKPKTALDMKRIESVKGSKFINKKIDNPQEIGEGAAETTGVGFSSSAEGT